MRITRLQLRRFGHFQDAEIALGDGSGLHVVHGPNEAGKSTTLDAIRYTLYGMPQARSKEPKYDFRHKTGQIRTALELVLDSGSTLAFARSRSTKASVLGFTDDAPDASLDDQLAGMLVGVPRTVWMAKHGINQASMRAGANALLTNAATDESIFAAATGMTSVTRVLDELRAARHVLLSDAGNAGEIHAAVAQYKAADAEHAKALRAAAGYAAAVATHHQLARHAEALREQRITIEQEHDQLRRAVEAAPRLAQRTDLVTRLAAISDVPASWTQTEHDLLETADQARTAQAARIARLTAKLGQQRADIESLTIDATLLAAAAQVDSLHQRLGAVAQASAQLPELRADVRRAGGELRAALEAIRPDAGDQHDASSALPSAAARAQLAAAIDMVAASDATVDAARVELEAARGELDQAAGDAPASGDAVERAGALAAAIDAASRVPVDEILQEAAKLATAREMLEQRATRIPGASLDLAAACRTQLPPESERVVLEQRYALLDTELQDAHRRLGLAEVKILERRAELTELELERDVPDPAQLDALRRERAEHFAPLRDALLAGEPLEDPARRVLGFEHDVQHADAYADRIAADAERVGSANTLRAHVAADEQRVDDEHEILERCATDRLQLDEAWRALWLSSGIAPASVEAMSGITTELLALRDDDVNLRRAADDHAVRCQRLEAARGDLVRVLGLADDPTAPTALDTLLQQAVARRTRLDELTQRAAKAQGQIEAATRARAQRTTALDQARAARAELQEHWCTALTAIGLEPGSSAIAARTQLEAFETLHERMVGAAAIERSVNDRAQFLSAFHDDVRTLAAAVGRSHDGDADASAVLVEQLRAQLSVVQRDDALHRERATRIGELEAELADSQADLAGAVATIDAMLERTGVVERAMLDALDQAWRAREQHRSDLREVEQSIVADTRMGIDALDELLAGGDAATLRSRIAQLAENLELLAGELAGATSARDDAGKQLGALEESSIQFDSRARMLDASARLAQLVPEHRSLALQERMLTTMLDDRARRDTGPVIERTCTYLEQITCGAWQRMLVGMDDHGSPQVQLQRGVDDAGSGNELPVPLDGLSEGTVDQLYLALRLAMLVEGTARGETMPFIVDDILPSFDDERARATMVLLAEVSASFQVIFLTHHEHLVRLAREVVDAGALHVHQLPRFGRATVTG